jgi:hypothetical protein
LFAGFTLRRDMQSQNIPRKPLSEFQISSNRLTNAVLGPIRG